MAQIPLRLISEQDYKTPEIIKLLRPLNDFIRAVTNALARGLTLADNMAAQTVDITVYTTAASAIPQLPISIKWDFPAITPKHVDITYIEGIDSDVEAVSSAVTPRWRYQDGYVVIRSLRGTLAASRAILVRFRIMA